MAPELRNLLNAYEHRTKSRRVIIILNDDRTYVSWLRRHRSGFVLDTRRKPTKRNATLHRAGCAEIRHAKSRRTHWTTGGRMKACSDDYNELTEWAREQIGGEAKTCPLCAPDADVSSLESVAASHAADGRLTRLESEIVSAVVESAILHLDNDIKFRMTVGDVARYLSKTPAQISDAMLRLAAEQLVEIDAAAGGAGPLSPELNIYPTASSLGTVPAFAELDADELQRELATLRA